VPAEPPIPPTSTRGALARHGRADPRGHGRDRAELAAADDGLTLVDGANGYRLATQPRFARWIRILREEPPPVKLSQSSLETLAVVAYRQPVTRAEIESVRGVSADAGIAKLLERELIAVVGRAELPGRPIQYGTTDRFLELVGHQVDGRAAGLRRPLLAPDRRVAQGRDRRATRRTTPTWASTRTSCRSARLRGGAARPRKPPHPDGPRAPPQEDRRARQELVELSTSASRWPPRSARSSAGRAARSTCPSARTPSCARSAPRTRAPIKNEALRAIYREIMSAAIALEKPLLVAYLGPEASNTHARR
jgi:hypothetical protein